MDVLSHPNAALKQSAATVDPLTETDLPDLCRKMAQIMYDAPGIGLAAPQVGLGGAEGALEGGARRRLGLDRRRPESTGQQQEHGQRPKRALGRSRHVRSIVAPALPKKALTARPRVPRISHWVS